MDYGRCKSCKAAVKSSPPTNQHPVFLQAGCPSCRPTNSVKALKGNLCYINYIYVILSYLVRNSHGLVADLHPASLASTTAASSLILKLCPVDQSLQFHPVNLHWSLLSQGRASGQKCSRVLEKSNFICRQIQVSNECTISKDLILTNYDHILNQNFIDKKIVQCKKSCSVNF